LLLNLCESSPITNTSTASSNAASIAALLRAAISADASREKWGHAHIYKAREENACIPWQESDAASVYRSQREARARTCYGKLALVTVTEPVGRDRVDDVCEVDWLDLLSAVGIEPISDHD
jgi:hypothetical protein